jgi:hypothetical protein
MSKPTYDNDVSGYLQQALRSEAEARLARHKALLARKIAALDDKGVMQLVEHLRSHGWKFD